jgi:hypothetical protein
MALYIIGMQLLTVAIYARSAGMYQLKKNGQI